METPISRPINKAYIPSAMKGVVLTSTGEILATPTPAELVNLFKCSPKVGLNFGKIFDFEEGDSGEKKSQERHEISASSPPPSPTSRKEREKGKDKDNAASENSISSSGTSAANTRKQHTVAAAPPPTRIRRPSIRSSHRASRCQAATSSSDPAELNNIDDNSPSTSNGHTQAKPLPHPHLRPSRSSSNLAAAVTVAKSLPIPVPRSHPSPEYDFADEENLPSPFLKRVDKAAVARDAAVAVVSSSSSNVLGTCRPNPSSQGPQSADSGSGLGSSSSSKGKRRGSSGLLLRAVAAANSTRRGTPSTSSSTSAVPMRMNGQTS